MEAKKVTDLRVGVRDENRVNVFLDGHFAFSLTIEQVADFKLKRGLILTEDEISRIQKASDFGKLFQFQF